MQNDMNSAYALESRRYYLMLEKSAFYMRVSHENFLSGTLLYRGEVKCDTDYNFKFTYNIDNSCNYFIGCS